VTGPRGKLALCLCGGGVTGGMYELGALAALDDFFARDQVGGGFSVNDFDVYVGTSAGAFVATLMASGMRVHRMVRGVLEEDQSLLPARRTDIYRFDPSQGFGVLRDIAGVLFGAVAKAVRRKPFSEELLGELLEVLPAGIFSLRHYERYLDRFLRHHQLATTFAELSHELLITANDLDSGHRAVFGRKPLDDVPLATAMCASSAIPLFFEPVRWNGRDYVDGAVGKVAHADLALERGATLVVVVNPLVPYRHDPEQGTVPSALAGARHIGDKGLLAVYGQAGKMSTRTKLHQGLRRYHAQHPEATFLLIEPREEEADMFLQNPMSWESRKQMVRYGYSSTTELLRTERAKWLEAFERHGVPVAAAAKLA